MTREDPASLEEICRLPDEEREARVDAIRRELLPLALRSEALANGRAWEFPADPGLRAELEALVRFERVCCPGLGWELRALPGGEALRLEVEGIDPFANAGTSPSQGSGRLRRFVRAGALGFAGSFLALCVLPLAIVAAGGSALAGWAAGLDDPRWIGAGTLVAGAVAWHVLSRRAREHREAGGDCGC